MNTTINGVGAYASSDLARPHPTKPDYYCIWGRVDDQIMHNNGEKVGASSLYRIWEMPDVASARPILDR